MSRFRAWARPLPGAFQGAAGVGACLGSEGEPDRAEFEAAGVPWPARLDASVSKRRREYLAGRLAAAAALAQQAGTSVSSAAGLWDLSAKDDRLPAWPPGLCGSISHSGALALAWVAPLEGPGSCGGLGVDVEHWMSVERCERLQYRIAPELARLPSPGLPATAVLTLAFSAKESLFKALYPQVRRHLGFDAAEVVELAPDGAALRLRLACDWSAQWPAGKELQALACVGPGGPDQAAGHVMTLVQLPRVK